jgi:hypothetical protein
VSHAGHRTWRFAAKGFGVVTEIAWFVALAARSSVSPLWLTKVTPVAASQAAPLSEVIVPVPETAVMRTGNGFGFETLSLTVPLAPG